jgi:hypothetical protein
MTALVNVAAIFTCRLISFTEFKVLCSELKKLYVDMIYYTCWVVRRTSMIDHHINLEQ